MELPYWVKVIGLIAVHLLGGAYAWLGLTRVQSAGEVLVGVVAGHALLDGFTLLVHFTLDNYFSGRTPFIGTTVRYFREHHVDPMAMFGRGYVENNFENGMIGLGTLAALALFAPYRPWLMVTLGYAALGSAYITLVHRWTHADPPRIVRALQAARLLVGPRHHAAHHRGEGRNYGLFAGWCDGLVDALRLLEGVEWLTRRFGVTPLHPRLEGPLGAPEAPSDRSRG